MNKTVPTGRLCDTAAEKNTRARRGSKLRVIDEGTPYDVTGRMIRWAREIRTGKLGRCTDVLIVARCIGPDGIAYEHFSNGTGTRETYMAMAQNAVKRHS
jgi:hypothetical protein